jgi:hypothetical protein
VKNQWGDFEGLLRRVQVFLICAEAGTLDCGSFFAAVSCGGAGNMRPSVEKKAEKRKEDTRRSMRRRTSFAELF